jgi:hypothetical protein
MLISKALGLPLDLFRNGEIAKILRVHPREELMRLLKIVVTASADLSVAPFAFSIRETGWAVWSRTKIENFSTKATLHHNG